jgi:hypothetical protein
MRWRILSWRRGPLVAALLAALSTGGCGEGDVPAGAGTASEADAPASGHRSGKADNGFINGRYPEDIGCAADARTVASADIVDNGGSHLATVELRWSDRCGVNWSRVSSDLAHPDALFATIETPGDGASYSNESTLTPMWSPVIVAPDRCAVAKGSVDVGYAVFSAQTPCI